MLLACCLAVCAMAAVAFGLTCKGTLFVIDGSVSTPSLPVAQDRDGDGLADLAETAAGSDPYALDSDGDGVPDGEDPLPLSARDTDGDGLQDDWETVWFGGLYPGAADDADADGVSNIDEQRNGTAPVWGNVEVSNSELGLTVFTPLAR